ncbi:MAG: GyrI-like domain-containing protein [Bacteroidales bacterium]
MKFLKIPAWILLIILVIIFAGGLFLPKKAIHEQSVNIERAPAEIFKPVLHFQKALLPDSETAAEEGHKKEPETGEGDLQKPLSTLIGQATQTINDVKENEHIEASVHHKYLGKTNVIWTFTPHEEGTQLALHIQTELSYPFQRWIYILKAKTTLSKYLNNTLSMLKLYVDRLPEKQAAEVEIKEISISGAQPTLALTDSATMDEISEKIRQSFETLYAFYDNSSAMLADAPYIRWHTFNPEGYSKFEAFLVLTEEIEGNEQLNPGETYEGKAIVANHTGPYENSSFTREALKNYIEENELETNGTPFSVFLTDPISVQDPGEISFDIYFPVK